MLSYVRVSLFESPAQTLVNTVNLVGVMGKGIAREFKSHYPAMFAEYKKLCDSKQLKIGALHLWRGHPQWVLNFPTKTTWKQPSRLEYVEAGLVRFRDTYEQMGVTSISFPPLGCGNGNLSWSDVRPLMEKYLKPIPIPVYIHDRHVGVDFVPEHLEGTASEPPAAFDQFLSDIGASILESRGLFETLRDKNEFRVIPSDDGLRIQHRDGSSDRVITLEEIEFAWAYLQAGILTADQYSTDAARRYKSYLFPILCSLPYIQVAEIQHIRGNNTFPGHGLFMRKRPAAVPEIDEKPRQGELCLSR
jgi:O-acetyl-ADP-ribose deacetylase (regulator of RNase III)